MNNTVQKIPFLRPTISLAVGVFIASEFEFQEIFLIAFCIATFLFLLVLNYYYRFRFTSLFGFAIQILFLLIGILTFQNHNSKPAFNKNGYFVATILEKPQEKKNSFKSILLVSQIKKQDSILNSNENILVYFEKDKNIKNLKPGDQILFRSTPHLLKNYGNPFEFDYKSYLENKRIYRQVYLSSENWKVLEGSCDFSIFIYAENVREKLLSIYRQQNLGKNEFEILSALTLGYKRGLDPETKRIFSAAGAMHVLAVSGLHVGIIFWLITLLFGILKKRKSGQVIFVILSISFLWSYALITGLSPSVTRAAAMFSIFVIGDNLNRKANTYNSLAASALFLLLFNPNNLFEVGFQLSYSAVFGIVFLQPKLSKLIQIKNKILNFFWTLLCVSAAAQISTFPLSVFYFNQFPSYFLISNLFIIPVVMVLIPLGMSLLLFSNISMISHIISMLIQFLIKGSYLILSGIDKLPHSIFKISIHPVELIFLVAVLLSLFLLIQNFSSQHLKTSLFFTLLLVTSFLLINVRQHNGHEIIVYNTTDNPSIHLIAGKRNYVFSEKEIEPNGNLFKQLNLSAIKLKLNSPTILSFEQSYKDSFLWAEKGLIIFEGKKILFQKNNSAFQKEHIPDFLVNPKQFNELEISFLSNTKIIVNKRFIPVRYRNLPTIHHLAKQGAFIEKW